MSAATDTLTEFFPTPASVIRRMVAPVADRLRSGTILEPSAGRGDILDHVCNVYSDKRNVYAIETDPELQLVLAGKGYRVLDSDFLAFREPLHFDVILMNPPFSRGDEHLLHAWELVAPGGVVVCLLNADTLRNAYTERRKLLAQIVSDHGDTEDLGQPFKTAARPTDVQVTMVVLRKPASKTAGLFDGETFDSDAPEQEREHSESPLAQRDLLSALVAQYEASVRLVRERYELGQKLAFYLKGVQTPRTAPKDEPALNDQIQAVKDLFWGYVFERTKIGSAATSSVRAEFEQQRAQNRHMAFSVENVTAVLYAIRDNYPAIIERCVVEAFDKITALHKDNAVHTEGWVTNKSWKVARKIIVPWGVSWDDKWKTWSARSYQDAFFDDLDKACCHLTGQQFDSLERRGDVSAPRPTRVTVNGAIYWQLHANRDNWADKFESEFFTVKVHKKGTVHLVFKDEALWARFNQVAARGKKWIGGGEA